MFTLWIQTKDLRHESYFGMFETLERTEVVYDKNVNWWNEHFSTDYVTKAYIEHDGELVKTLK